MADLDLCYLPATEALQRFRARTLSPVEVLEARIARAETVEDRVNTLACNFFDEALDAAKQAEDRYERTDGWPCPLEGLTLPVKEDMAVEGKPRTFGSLIFKDNVADHTNPSVERLIEAGAIIHALTTCPEFVWPWTCMTRLHGTTRNPWNLDVTCGGGRCGRCIGDDDAGDRIGQRGFDPVAELGAARHGQRPGGGDPHDTVMTALLNCFSRCPNLAVPSGFAPNGVPTGVQLVGNPYDNATVFRVAAALENTLPLYGPGAPRPEL